MKSDDLLTLLDLAGKEPRPPDAESIVFAPLTAPVDASPTALALLRDTTGRYPDVASAVPRSPTTVVSLDEADAALLLDRLPVLPGAGDVNQPVTLDLDEGVAVRGRDASTDSTVTIRLERSSVSGPAVRIVLDRQRVVRALSLGCFTLQIAASDKPVAAEGPNRTFVLMTLDPATAVGPEQPLPAPKAVLPARLPITPRSSPMKTHETNGHAHPGRADPVLEDTIDPLVEAETLRTHLAEAAASVGRRPPRTPTGFCGRCSATHREEGRFILPGRHRVDARRVRRTQLVTTQGQRSITRWAACPASDTRLMSANVS